MCAESKIMWGESEGEGSVADTRVLQQLVLGGWGDSTSSEEGQLPTSGLWSSMHAQEGSLCNSRSKYLEGPDPTFPALPALPPAQTSSTPGSPRAVSFLSPRPGLPCNCNHWLLTLLVLEIFLETSCQHKQSCASPIFLSRLKWLLKCCLSFLNT